MEYEGRNRQKKREHREHSIKVPQLYKEAANILRKYENQEGSLKNLIYSGKYKSFGSISALLHKLVYNQVALKSAIAASNMLVEQPRFDPHLAQVLAAQLISKGPLAGNCTPVLVFKKYEDKIQDMVSKQFVADAGVKDKDHLPRWVRVNTLVASVNDVHNQLEIERCLLEDYDSSAESYDDFLERVKNLAFPYYLIDYHIPELLVFPPGTPFWDSILYQKGAVILQDKASCLPVFLSGIKETSCVLDACAAPGNKTSYMAAKMNNQGKVIANEFDEDRFDTMRNLLQSRHATCVVSQNSDFYALKPADYPNITHIFVDPTCSSSGTQLHNDKIPKERVGQWAGVQKALLKHALSFPSVKEVIYSTCSILEEENENVVKSALGQYREKFKLKNIASRLKGWKHFGDHTYEFGGKCLRTNMNVDRCTGFFIAKFVRKHENSGRKKESLMSQDSSETTIAEKSDKQDIDSAEALNGHPKKRKFEILYGSEELEQNDTEKIEVGEDKPKKKKKSKKSWKSECVTSDSNQNQEALMEGREYSEQNSLE